MNPSVIEILERHLLVQKHVTRRIRQNRSTMRAGRDSKNKVKRKTVGL